VRIVMNEIVRRVNRAALVPPGMTLPVNRAALVPPGMTLPVSRTAT
jgi:hypothetical protein